VFVVVYLDILFDFAILVPVLDLDEILVKGRVRERCPLLFSVYQHGGTLLLTPSTMPSCTSPGNFLILPDGSFPARLPHSILAFSSTAISTALKGTLLARRIVSSRDVAVTICEEPAVRDVKT